MAIANSWPRCTHFEDIFHDAVHIFPNARYLLPNAHRLHCPQSLFHLQQCMCHFPQRILGIWRSLLAMRSFVVERQLPALDCQLLAVKQRQYAREVRKEVTRKRREAFCSGCNSGWQRFEFVRTTRLRPSPGAATRLRPSPGAGPHAAIGILAIGLFSRALVCNPAAAHPLRRSTLGRCSSLGATQHLDRAWAAAHRGTPHPQSGTPCSNGGGGGLSLGISKGGVAACQARAGHLFGPHLIWRCNPHFLHGPCPVGDMGNAPFHKFFVPYRGYF